MSEKGDEDWSSNANEAVTVKIVEAGPDATTDGAPSFHPQFTYPIFGEEESIFGYKDLDIKISFAAHDLYPNVHVEYEEKFVPVGDTEAVDVTAKLKEFLPSCPCLALTYGLRHADCLPRCLRWQGKLREEIV